jgi:hypothetical protein
MRWRGPAATINDRPIAWLERTFRKDYESKYKVEKNNNNGRGPQGAWRQDELIGSKPPAVK